MSDWLREQANDEREARKEDWSAYRELLRLETANATLLSALKAMDEALTRDFGAHDSIISSDPDRSIAFNEAWLQIRSAITSAEAR